MNKKANKRVNNEEKEQRIADLETQLKVQKEKFEKEIKELKTRLEDLTKEKAKLIETIDRLTGEKVELEQELAEKTRQVPKIPLEDEVETKVKELSKEQQKIQKFLQEKEIEEQEKKEQQKSDEKLSDAFSWIIFILGTLYYSYSVGDLFWKKHKLNNPFWPAFQEKFFNMLNLLIFLFFFFSCFTPISLFFKKKNK